MAWKFSGSTPHDCCGDKMGRGEPCMPPWRSLEERVVYNFNEQTDMFKWGGCPHISNDNSEI